MKFLSRLLLFTLVLPMFGQRITLRDLSVSLEELAQHVKFSVVQIFATGYSATEESDSTNTSLLSKQKSTGSGVILSGDGYIVTNSHVVRGARRIQVRMPAEGKTIEAKLVGMDRESDLAVLKVDLKGLKPLKLGDSDLLRQGEFVMAFGNPLGLEGSVSTGIVSATARQIKPDDPMVYIQTDASINPGNSGGPLVDAEGSLIGINTFILTQSGGSEGIGFAIPSNTVRSVFDQIRREGHVHRGEIGIYAQSVTPALMAGLGLPQDWGVLVGDVEPEGPADRAGLKVGDIVVSLNGKKMQNARQLEVNVYRYPRNERVTLEVVRGADRLSVQIPVTEREDDPLRFADLVTPEDSLVSRLNILGVGIDKQLSALLPDLRHPWGVVVAAGTVQGLNVGTALQPGDVLYSVNGLPVTSVVALRKRLTEFKPGDTPVLQIERSNKLMYVVIELE
jgi:serine protease Do